MRIDVLTLFPGVFPGPLAESIPGRALERGLAELRAHDLHRIAAPVDALQHTEIGPDFGLGHAATGFEHADHAPDVRAPGHLPAEVHVAELREDPTADDDLVFAGLEHPPGDDAEAFAHADCAGRDAAKRHVGAGAGAAHGQVHDRVELGRRDRPERVPGDASRRDDDVDLLPAERARQLVGRTAAQHQRDVVPPGQIERGAESLAHRQQRDEHRNHAADANDRAATQVITNL